MTNSISFSKCPECEATVGTRGLPRHLEQIHGIAPATRSTGKPVKLDSAALAILREAATGTISEQRLGYKTTLKSLIKKGLLTAELTITEAGRARVA